MSEELKPCPFCGNKASIGKEGSMYEILCCGPGCYLLMRCITEDKNIAIQKWNTRPDSKPYKYADVQETQPHKHPCDHEPAYNIGFFAGFNAARELKE